MRKAPVLFALLALVLLPAAAEDRAPAITSIAEGAVAPANWLHPLIEWEDEASPGTAYAVTVTAESRRLTLATSEKRLLLSGRQFAPFLRYPEVRIKVRRRDGPAGRAGAMVRVKIDAAALDDTVIYRMVARITGIQLLSCVFLSRIILVHTEDPGHTTNGLFEVVFG